MCMEYQGKNSKGRLTTLDDFGLKCCTEGRESKNKITERSLRKAGCGLHLQVIGDGYTQESRITS